MADLHQKLAEAGYEATIGLEVHVQLNSQSKLFAADPNDPDGDPNSHVSVITLGHPGTLPVLNEAVLEKAIKMGLACDCDITEVNHFARKNYFYPDLPKGYQTTQDKTPICMGGTVRLFGEGLERESIPLHHIHLEEDAGKSIHDEGPDTLIDLNRAGTPLIEIVTEPAIENAAEAAAFLQEVRRLVRYLDISGGNMERGELRCDANISIKPIDSEQLGNKVEIKNMNSINNVRKAIDHEIERQLACVANAEEIAVETRTFDASSGKTYGMRFKETMNDYRYFPCPDLAPFVVDAEILSAVREKQPMTPDEFRQKFTTEYRLSDYDVGLLTEEKETASFFVALCECTNNFKAAANVLNGPLKGLLNELGRTMDAPGLSVEQLAGYIALIDEAKVSASIAAQRILPQLIDSGKSALEIAEASDLIMDGDEDALLTLVREVLNAMPDKVVAYKKGKKGLMGLFTGQVMKKSQGKADPRKVQALLQEELKKDL